jgi:hypothetical protein
VVTDVLDGSDIHASPCDGGPMVNLDDISWTSDPDGSVPEQGHRVLGEGA